MLRWRLLLGALFIAALVGLLVSDYRLAASNTLPPGSILVVLALGLAIVAGDEALRLLDQPAWSATALVVHAGNLALVAISFGCAIDPDVGSQAGFTTAALASDAPAGTFEAGPAGTLAVAPEGAVTVAPTAGLAGPSGIALGLALVVAALFTVEIVRYQRPGVVPRLAANVLAVAYVGLLLAVLVQLRLVHGNGWGLVALVSLVTVVKMGDTGAYTVGRLIGRRKMAPALSPGKTIEGGLGGLVFGCLGAWIAVAWMPLWLGLSDVQPAWWRWIAYGLLVAVAGTLGDLAESLLKREAGQKDSSTWMPGFGGVLDMLDSALFAAPVAYLCWLLGLVGPGP